MAVPIIRAARDADMAALRGDIGGRFELFGLWPGGPGVPDFLDAERAFGDLMVGEVDGRVVGFGGTLRRGKLTHLGDLFVLPEHQSSGVGRMILAELFPQDGARSAFASDDERAIGLYVRHGMIPRCPLFDVEGPPRALAGLRRPRADGDPTLAVAGPDVAGAMDARVSGGDRTDCLTWYAGLPGVTVLAGRSGYAFTRVMDEEVLVGPVGGDTPDDCVNVALQAIAAHPDAELAQVSVPGTHPLLPVLLGAGWRIEDMDTLMVSDDMIRLDRYLPHADLG
ncbi:GNAT family N-acetyltransferase [Sphaerisporangium melleum]|nr:GNAT family N-acetyltransferase [Sphaerisporangium melleum]